MTTENGKAVELEGDPRHPYTRGKLYVKMNGFLTDVVYNPERVLYPLKRDGEKGEGRFKRVSWDEALDSVAARLKSIIEEYGAEAILPYSYAGTMGVVQKGSLDRRLFSRLGATNLERTICGNTAWAGVAATIGTGTGILPEDLRHSRIIIMWGGNPVVTNPHIWPFVEEARASGARLVVIDPLRSATADRADWHLRPRPGTDPALALGMMNVIVREGLHDTDYLERYSVGFKLLKERLDEYPLDRVAEITGVRSEDIVKLAKGYATSGTAAIQVHIGMEKHRHGGMSYRSIACLPALVGAWREPGGGLLCFTSDLFDEAMNLSPLTTTGEELVKLALERDHPALEGITYERLRQEGWAPLNLPEPRLPFADGGFPTPSGKCELYSESMKTQGLDPLPAYVKTERAPDKASKYPLHFMSPKWNPYFVNSSHANQPRLEGAAGKPLLRIHPTDAAKRGITNGDRVRVFNQRGSVSLRAEVTDAMRQKIVIFLHGWWASRIGGSSANALTSETLADQGGGSSLHDTWVEIEKTT
jgi:anaerobic selenocysteine-containing dehydrogenase